MRLRSLTCIAAVAIISIVPSAAPAESSETWRQEANRVCRQLSIALAPAYDTYFTYLSRGPEEAGRHAAQVELLNTVSRRSMAANARLGPCRSPGHRRQALRQGGAARPAR